MPRRIVAVDQLVAVDLVGPAPPRSGLLEFDALGISRIGCCRSLPVRSDIEEHEMSAPREHVIAEHTLAEGMYSLATCNLLRDKTGDFPNSNDRRILRNGYLRQGDNEGKNACYESAHAVLLR
jgi:hypothetical protein